MESPMIARRNFLRALIMAPFAAPAVERLITAGSTQKTGNLVRIRDGNLVRIEQCDQYGNCIGRVRYEETETIMVCVDGKPKEIRTWNGFPI